MLFDTRVVAPSTFEERSGWHLEPQGLCKGDRCVPLPGTGDGIDLETVADRLGMPLVHDPDRGLWVLGPEVTGRALASAELPDPALLDLDGRGVRLRSFLGRKLLLVAWASW